jgi:hypothetical protein
MFDIEGGSMDSCKLLEGCLFFHEKMNNMPTVTDMLKRLYCLWNYKQCARYMVAEKFGKDQVPQDLFPNDITKAKIILTNHI